MRDLVIFCFLLSLCACAKPSPAPALPDAGHVPACTAGEGRCTESGFERCAVDGEWAPPTSCLPGICLASACTACTPGSRQCGDAGVELCNEIGQWVPEETCAAGGQCVEGECFTACELAERDRSYIGCEYWPTVLPNSELAFRTLNTHPEPNYPIPFTFAVVVANPGTLPAQVVVDRGGVVVAQQAVAPGELAVLELPWVHELKNQSRFSLVARTSAYHLTSTMPVVAYQFNPLEYIGAGDDPFSYTSDASLLLPTGVLSTDYLTSTVSTDATRAVDDLGRPERRRSKGGFVAVVGTRNGTTVNLRLSAHTVPLFEESRGTLEEHVSGDTIVVTLDRGDVLLLKSEDGAAVFAGGVVPDSCVPLAGNSEEVGCALDRLWDLSGTRITATQPVAVYTGHNCTYVPYDVPACDHLEEQLLPSRTWGQRTLAVRAAAPGGVEEGYVNSWKVISATDDNRITFTPEAHAPVTLDAGEHLMFESDARAFVVEGTGPILVTQFLAGAHLPQRTGGEPRTMGDPSMAFVPPADQFRSDYLFLTPSTYVESWVTVMGSVDAQVMVDGAPMGALTPIAGTSFGHARLRVEPGVHRLRTMNGERVGLLVYGYADYTSYMFAGGLDLTELF